MPSERRNRQYLVYAPCCHAYLREGLRLIPQFVYRGFRYRNKYDLWAAPVVLRWNLRVLLTRRCPWHDRPEWGFNGWKNYLAVMEAAKSPEFESRLGPIEVNA